MLKRRVTTKLPFFCASFSARKPANPGPCLSLQLKVAADKLERHEHAAAVEVMLQRQRLEAAKLDAALAKEAEALRKKHQVQR